MYQLLALAIAGAMGTGVTEGSLATRDGDELVDVPLEHTRVRIAVAGVVADVTVEQRFRNPYAAKIDASYLFPLPTGAAVNAMSITTGGHTIRGLLMPRDQARESYRAARARGHVAALLTEERPNLFTQAVANIEPGAVVEVSLHYVEPLVRAGDGYELVFPMVAGPRHVPKSSRLTPEAVAALQAPVLPEGQRPRHDIEIAVTGLASARSPSHRIAAGDDALSLAPGDTIPNKDFVLRWDAAPGTTLVAHRAPGQPGSFFLVAEPPPAAAAPRAPREVILAVDSSSSMAGRPLARARELVRRILADLGPDDTFQIVRFDDGASGLGPRLLAARPRNVGYALAWLDALEAAGGTDMAAGVSAAFGFPHDPARLRVVVFLTDGFIGNEDEVAAAVRAHLGDARIFAFGLGSAVNRYLLEELAAAGRGAAAVVGPGDDVDEAARRFAERLARPVLTDVTIDWGGLAVEEVTPAALPDLFAGQPLVVAGRYRKAGRATVTLRGRRAGAPVSMPLTVTLPDEETAHPAVDSVWARARLAELERREQRGEASAAAEITRVALAAGLVTRHTAFVAVDADRVTAGGPAETVAVPVAIPEGVDRRGSSSGGGGTGSGTIGLGALGTIGHATGSGSGFGSVMGYSSGLQIKDAPIVLTEPSVEGSRRRREIKQCIVAAQALRPDLSGLLTVEVGRDGVAVTGIDDAALLACVRARAQAWEAGHFTIQFSIGPRGDEEEP